VFHFLLVSVNGSKVTVTPTDEMGRTFDVQTYTFGGGTTDTENPSTPTNLQASASSDRVDLSWTASTDNVGVTGYRVFRDSGLIATTGPVTSYTDATVAPSTTYSYTVQAFDAAGNRSGQSAPAVATTLGSGGQQLTFTPSDDAYIVQGSASSNFGTASTLQADGSPIKDFLMKFAVSGVGTSTVTSAQLRLFVADPSTSGGTIHPTTNNSWTEGSVTWANAPPSASAPATSIGAVSTGTWVVIDLTPFVTGDGVVSLRVSSTNTNGADYASKEGAGTTKPQLIVTTG
jgi:chitodextrinase